MKGWIGLCLALTLTCVGCRSVPEAAFSPDSSQVAYTVASKGLAIRDSVNPGTKRYFKVGSAHHLSWSPSGRYLVWTNTSMLRKGGPPPDTILFEVSTGKLKKLPVHMAGPFLWPTGDSVIQGFALVKSLRESDDSDELQLIKSVKFHVELGKKVEEAQIGKLVPIGQFPNSQEVLFAGEGKTLFRGAVGQISAMSVTEVADSRLLALSADGRILLADQKDTFYVDGNGAREALTLPSQLNSDKPLHRELRHLDGISPDAKWLIVIHREDVSPTAVIPDAETILNNSLKNGPSDLAAAHYRTLMDQAKFEDTYQLIERATSAALDITTLQTGGSSAGTATDYRWSSNGRYMTAALETPDGEQEIWLINLETKVRVRMLG